MQALTKFGEELCKLRFDRGENQTQMARRMGKTNSSFSRIVRGGRPPSERFVQEIIHEYELDEEDAMKLMEAARLSR